MDAALRAFVGCALAHRLWQLTDLDYNAVRQGAPYGNGKV